MERGREAPSGGGCGRQHEGPINLCLSGCQLPGIGVLGLERESEKGILVSHGHGQSGQEEHGQDLRVRLKKGKGKQLTPSSPGLCLVL